VIDFEMAYRSGEQGIKQPSFGGGVILRPTEEDEEELKSERTRYDAEEIRQARYLEFVQKTSLLEYCSLEDLQEDRLILLPVRAFGYVFLSRKWCAYPEV
jgi:hypothetical protein